jgi:hypothetical protein
MTAPVNRYRRFKILLIAGTALCAIIAVVVVAVLAAAPSAHRSFRGSPGDAMITNNPDGTFTIQKKPPHGTSDASKGKNGLVIPPQVVVPIDGSRGKRD